MPIPRANPLEPDFTLCNARALSARNAASCVWDAPFPLRFWHLASLDAPTVALVWALGFAWAARVRLPLWVPMLLTFVAWAVYVGDRLLDARTGLSSGALHRLRKRHRFHWRHRWIFIPLGVTAACAAVWIFLVLMPAGARERDSLLAVAALAYFTRIHSTRPLQPASSLRKSSLSIKELLVGFLFTSGCVLPAISIAAIHTKTRIWPLIVPAVYFALLAWLNCHAIEIWESRDKPYRHSKVYLPACILALVGMLMAVSLTAYHPRPAALIVTGAASALALALLDRHRNHLTPLALRVAADLVLLTPLTLLLQ